MSFQGESIMSYILLYETYISNCDGSSWEEAYKIFDSYNELIKFMGERSFYEKEGIDFNYIFEVNEEDDMINSCNKDVAAYIKQKQMEHKKKVEEEKKAKIEKAAKDLEKKAKQNEAAEKELFKKLYEKYGDSIKG